MKLFKLLLHLALITAYQSIYSQTTETFDDGDFTHNPTWLGDTSEYRINSNLQLQLNASEAGSRYLLLPSSRYAGTQEWRFYIRVALAPSDNNNARIYLTTNNLNLHSDSITGYYLQFGENLSQDAIELFYQEGTEKRSICRGEDGHISASFALNIKVLLHENGLWEIFEVSPETGKYQLHTSGSSDPPDGEPIVGFFNKFTSGSKNKFYLDDIYHGPEIIDTTPPTLLNISGAHSCRAVTLQFSEKMATEWATESRNYTIDNSFHPDSIAIDEESFTEIELHFSNELADRIPHTLKMCNLQDLNGNIMEDSIVEFRCNKIRRHDLLITEFMADPSPTVGLPNCEYVEILNVGFPDTLHLKGWKLLTGGVERYIPNCAIAPNEYLVLLPNSEVEHQIDHNNIAYISSLSISNEGQELTLLDANDEVIHCINFRKDWHTHELKLEGGWSLEMIDTGNPCEGASNWASSEDPSGGTPGRANSIADVNPDTRAPALQKIALLDSTSLRVYFSESIMSALSAAHIAIDRGILVDSIAIEPPQNRSALLYLASPLQRNKLYTLTLTMPVADCVGNESITHQSLYFGIPEFPKKGDIVINEVLFNAFDGTSADYVELFNRSENVIDLQELFIGYGTTGIAEQWARLSSEGDLLLPGEWVAICRDKALTQEQYTYAVSERLIQNEELPALNNETGTIFLTDNQGIEIDEFTYHENMHYAMLRSHSGVALERVSADAPTQSSSNWKSAAESIGFGTPGGKNSQCGSTLAENQTFVVTPEVFSPDNDGHGDFSELLCRFEQSEYRVTVTIFDANGRQIKNLANNIIAQAEERFLWDGTDGRGQKVPIGIYMFELQYWNLDGEREKIRKAVGVIYR